MNLNTITYIDLSSQIEKQSAFNSFNSLIYTNSHQELECLKKINIL